MGASVQRPVVPSTIDSVQSTTLENLLFEDQVEAIKELIEELASNTDVCVDDSLNAFLDIQGVVGTIVDALREDLDREQAASQDP